MSAVGINMVARDRSREKLGELPDPQSVLPSLLNRLWAREQDMGLCFLPYIDAYGDTVFNHLQAKDLLKEWELLYGLCTSEDERQWLEDAEALINACIEGHGIIRCEGD